MLTWNADKTWVSDLQGNRCSVRFWGTKEAAEKALGSLRECTNCVDCTGCINCIDCTDCADCSRCVDCAGCLRCVGCTDCARCTGCADCIRCADCTDCTDCTDCAGCAGCTDCEDCADCLRCAGCEGCTDCTNCSNLTDCSDERAEKTKEDVAGNSIARWLRLAMMKMVLRLAGLEHAMRVAWGRDAVCRELERGMTKLESEIGRLEDMTRYCPKCGHGNNAYTQCGCPKPVWFWGGSGRK